jgi:hypothetical protein
LFENLAVNCAPDGVAAFGNSPGAARRRSCTRTTLIEPGPITLTWGSDNAYRLTSEKRENAGGVLYRDTFTYDKHGWLIFLDHLAPGSGYADSHGYQFDDANRLTSHSYSPAGDTTIANYFYDQSQQLTSVNYVFGPVNNGTTGR